MSSTKQIKLLVFNRLLELQANMNVMKIFTNILVFVASALVIFNITQLDFNNLFKEDNAVAFIGIAASCCAILILIIFRMSKKIEDKMNDKQ